MERKKPRTVQRAYSVLNDGSWKRGNAKIFM